MLIAKSTQPPTTAATNDYGDFSIRSFQPMDRADVLHLYEHGLLGGRLTSSDGAADLVYIERTYFSRSQDHFWVAQAKSSVIGTIAVSEDDQQIMNLRRLRVAPLWQVDARVASGLVKTAIQHARIHGCLKLVFHTSLEGPRAVELLDGLGLQLSKIRHKEGQHLIEFYDDLYASHAGDVSAAESQGNNLGA